MGIFMKNDTKELEKFLATHPDIKCCNCAECIPNDDFLHVRIKDCICSKHDRLTYKNAMCSDFRPLK